MNCIERISIENFRGIKHLEMEGFSKINLIFGKNNVGKTSILESLFLLLGMSNPELPNAVNAFRLPYNSSNWDYLQYLFHNIELDSQIKLSGTVKQETRSVEISLQSLYHSLGQSSSSTDAKNFDSIKLSYKRGNIANQMTSTFSFLPDGRITRQLDTTYKENVLAKFISSARNNDLGSEFSQYLKQQKNGNRDELLAMLKAFDNNISSIDMLNDGLYIGFNNINGLVPLAFAGDGLKLFLNTLISVANSNNDVILVDEMDNGLHYSSYILFWKSLIKLISQKNTQIFLTTHNREILEALARVLKENANSRHLASFYSISNFEDAMHAYKYDAEEFMIAIESDLELRR